MSRDCVGILILYSSQLSLSPITNPLMTFREMPLYISNNLSMQNGITPEKWQNDKSNLIFTRRGWWVLSPQYHGKPSSSLEKNNWHACQQLKMCSLCMRHFFPILDRLKKKKQREKHCWGWQASAPQRLTGLKSDEAVRQAVWHFLHPWSS